MSYLIIDLEESSIIARYNDRQDAERVCEAFNTVEEVNRRCNNNTSIFNRRYIVINGGNSSPNHLFPATIVISSTATTPINNWNHYIGGNATNVISHQS